MNTPFDDIFASAEREQAIAAAAAAPKLPLWEHQAECIAQIDEALAAGINRIVVKIPTGGGKTRLASELILQKKYLEFGARVGFWMPRLDLVEQTIAAFRQAGIANVGVIQGLHRLKTRRRRFRFVLNRPLPGASSRKFDLIFIDECHLQFKKILAWIDDPKLQSTPVIGLSATPWSKGLGKHYHRLINPTSIKDLIEKKILCPFVVYAPPGPDLSRVRTLAGDYHEGDLSEACNTVKLAANIVETWKLRGENRQTILFGIDRKHAKTPRRKVHRGRHCLRIRRWQYPYVRPARHVCALPVWGNKNHIERRDDGYRRRSPDLFLHHRR